MDKLPSDFSALPDTAKVRALIDMGVSPDTMAVFVSEVAAGMRPGISIQSPEDVLTYVYTNCSDEDFTMFSATFESHVENLPPAAKMKVYALSASAAGNADKMGYKIGLEYLNSVLEKDLSIGAIDKEIAEFRRACGKDEDTYQRFLKGFAAAISTRAPGELPAELVSKYGK